jgi:HrpA-like RNA helicase
MHRCPIQATNIAETSITIPDVIVVIDAGRERQSTMLDSESDNDSISVVGSQLITVNISRSSATQREGRAGRVSDGTCYRLYSRQEMEEFDEFIKPEILRMELSQLVLHSLSMYHPSSGHPLSLLLGTPNPPTEAKLWQALHDLAFQGLVEVYEENEDIDSNFTPNETGTARVVRLTPLGRAVCNLQLTPSLGRMLFVGLVLRAIDPALSIAALLSVPRAFSAGARSCNNENDTRCSDLGMQLEQYHSYLAAEQFKKRNHPQSLVFAHVTRIRAQLEKAMLDFLASSRPSTTNWNANSHRVAAQVGLICAATPHIAHLVNARHEFATRDVVSHARMHPTSVNFKNENRAHWYVYHELRTSKEAYLNVTTAASPLDLALFSYASSMVDSDDESGFRNGIQALVEDDDWLFIADQWVPVVVSVPSQRRAFAVLRRLLTHDMLQQVAQNPATFSSMEEYEQVILFVLSAVEQQRLMK